MEPLGKCVTKKRQIGEEEISKQSGFLFKKTSKQTKPVYEEYEDWIPLGGVSETHSDIRSLAQKIEDACNQLAAEGYHVINISKIESGRYHHDVWQGKNHYRDCGAKFSKWGAAYAYGYGYSVTDGAIITAMLNTDSKNHTL